MKSKTIPAMIIAAALIILTYLLFFNKNKQQTHPFNITGEWKLDTAYPVQPVNDSIQRLIATITDKRAPFLYVFGSDSSFSRRSSKDNTSEKYYLRDSVLYFDEGYGFTPYPVKTMTDSLFEFVNKDSIVFVLKKK